VIIHDLAELHFKPWEVGLLTPYLTKCLLTERKRLLGQGDAGQLQQVREWAVERKSAAFAARIMGIKWNGSEVR
jgi:hypothetical protein